MRLFIECFLQHSTGIGWGEESGRSPPDDKYERSELSSERSEGKERRSRDTHTFSILGRRLGRDDEAGMGWNAVIGGLPVRICVSGTVYVGWPYRADGSAEDARRRWW